MTGKDLIIYILSNNLENEPVYKDGRLLGFMTSKEAAAKFDVGESTIVVWACTNKIPCIQIEGRFYIPAYVGDPRKGGPNA